MRISKVRIRTVEKYLTEIKRDDKFSIGVIGVENIADKLVKVGFTDALEIGERVLPKIVGSVSKFNADGSFIKRRDLEKEEYYISRIWRWKDYQGNEYSKIVYIRRERIYREPIEAPNVELEIREIDGNKILFASDFIKSESNFEQIKHVINLLLELFGECEILDDKNKIIIPPEVIRLNWKIFPKGDYPWEKVETLIKSKIATLPKGNQPIINMRNEKISSKEPSFFAYGLGGFSDYTVYGFPNLNLFILESMNMGNATYVFDRDWEELTKLTKKEIIDARLYNKRIVHTENWEQEIDVLFA